MTMLDLQNYVRTMLNAAFPTATIQFDRISEDPFHIGVSVYGVEANAVKWVKEKILDIDEKLCADSEFAITPLVRDEATTEKFYPQFASPWKWLPAGTSHAVPACASVAMESLQNMLNGSSTKWEIAEPLCSNAGNEELALAA
jgi:hypothetical protein